MQPLGWDLAWPSLSHEGMKNDCCFNAIVMLVKNSSERVTLRYLRVTVAHSVAQSREFFRTLVIHVEILDHSHHPDTSSVALLSVFCGI